MGPVLIWEPVAGARDRDVGDVLGLRGGTPRICDLAISYRAEA